MGNRTKTTLVALTLGILAATGLRAQETAVPAAPLDPPPTPERAWAFDLGADYASRYLFRGVSLLGDEHVLVPHARFGYGNFALYYGGDYGKIPDFGDDAFVEADFGADYTFLLGERVSFTLGAVTYQFNQPAEDDIAFLDTYELYGIVAIDTLLSPTISFYRDMDRVKGGFLSAGISHRFEFNDRVSLILSGSVGFDFGYNNQDVEDGTFNDVLIGADLPIRLSDGLAAHIMIQQSLAQRALDRKIGGDSSLDALYGDHTVLTAGLSYSF